MVLETLRLVFVFSRPRFEIEITVMRLFLKKIKKFRYRNQSRELLEIENERRKIFGKFYEFGKLYIKGEIEVRVPHWNILI